MYNDKQNSEKIGQLTPILRTLAEIFLELCDKAGLDILITSGYRSIAEQNALYAQGRDANGNIVDKGKVVTKCKGGNSNHNHRLAFDIVPIVNGKADWNDLNKFKLAGQIGKSLGLTWGGDFTSIIDMPHFEYTFGNTTSYYKNGGIVPSVLGKDQKGNVIKVLQEKLTTGGFDTKGADGIFGNNTELAVMKYQSANKLPSSGIVNAELLKKIFSPAVPLTFEKALAVLVENNIMDSPDYWRGNAAEGKPVKGEYAALLIMRMAEKLRG